MMWTSKPGADCFITIYLIFKIACFYLCLIYQISLRPAHLWCSLDISRTFFTNDFPSSPYYIDILDVIPGGRPQDKGKKYWCADCVWGNYMMYKNICESDITDVWKIIFHFYCSMLMVVIIASESLWLV